MNELLNAICEDDRGAVRRLLKGEPELARAETKEAELYRGKIFHWLYVGDTALHLAAAGHRVEMVELLLEAGADPNAAKNMRRSGPLHYAADGCAGASWWNGERQVRTIQCLLDAGAEINAADKNGATPLHRAVRTRCAAAVKCLLENGADATLRNKPGSTAFHLAVQNTGRGGSGTDQAKAAQEEIIRTFLAAGVSPETKDAKGKSVLEWARSESVRMLLK